MKSIIAISILILAPYACGQSIKTVTLEDLTKKGMSLMGQTVKVKFNDRGEVVKETAEDAGEERAAPGFYAVLYTYPDRDYNSYSVTAVTRDPDGVKWLEKLPIFDERDYSKSRLKVNFVYGKVVETVSGKAMIQLLGTRSVMGGKFDWGSPN